VRVRVRDTYPFSVDLIRDEHLDLVLNTVSRGAAGVVYVTAPPTRRASHRRGNNMSARRAPSHSHVIVWVGGWCR